MENSQEKLMEMVVEKVFKKHNLNVGQNSISDEEKEKLKSIVSNIKEDVEKFLKNQSQVKTEKDFPNNDNVTDTIQTPTSTDRKKVFSQPNDVKSVKYFNPRRK